MKNKIKTKQNSFFVQASHCYIFLCESRLALCHLAGALIPNQMQLSIHIVIGYIQWRSYDITFLYTNIVPKTIDARKHVPCILSNSSEKKSQHTQCA